GIQSDDLTAIDILLDADGDGAIDAEDKSVAVQVLGGVSHSTPAAIGLAAQHLARDSTRAYLVVGNVSAGVGATDRIRFDVVGATGASGPLSGIAPVSGGAPIVGTEHVASGYIELVSVELTNRQTGASGRVSLEFASASALAAGDHIALVFPPGFDLASALLAASSQAPSGAALARDIAASTRGVLVLALAAAEAAGRYQVTLDGVVNAGVAASDLMVEISSSKADGTLIDGPDPDPLLFSIFKRQLTLACRADFDGDGRVYFADLFRFGDAFGGAGSSIFDLDGDLAVGFSDFFVFTEVFGSRCDTAAVDAVDAVDEDAPALHLSQEILGATTMDFSLIRAGSFSMGSPSDEESRESDEGPQREIAISAAFYLGQYEVTQGQWTAVMGTKPWEGLPASSDQADHPAVYISWQDALSFVQTLNAVAGDSLYRLPSEAEWEYAARAGTATRWSFGDRASDLSTFAWTRRVPAVVSELVTHPVGSKRPNGWDLYDMHGSAAEWVLDYYGSYGADAATDPMGPLSGSVRVLRGGGLMLAAADTRSAARDAFDPAVRLSTFGFRIVRRIAAEQ
ncbi:MAG: formylglycine-generating enzyme family protein, partial [Candidatus Latescibacteria bacterium]|nr:formylglycine-generating enzyme family protein [Candidatus Latescibacterota bacterium]